MQQYIVLAAVAMFLTIDGAHATMPKLTEQPKPASPIACREWAAKQDDEALEMWGIQESGKYSDAVGLGRLADWCMGRGVPAIVVT